MEIVDCAISCEKCNVWLNLEELIYEGGLTLCKVCYLEE